MKKILLAFDGKHFPVNAFEFARGLNEKDPFILTGIFLPEPAPFTALGNGYGTDFPEYSPLVEEMSLKQIERNINRFKSLCDDYKILYNIHNNFSDFVFPDLKRETRFADILLLSETFYDSVRPNDKSLKVAIEEAECPVMVVPEEFDFPTRNILAYDGSASSVFAMKQFAYLFPELTLNETLLMMMDEKGIPGQLPDQPLIESLMTRHFPNLTMEKEQINPDKYFPLWLAQKKNALLVTGSLGRSALSQLFEKSFIADLFKDLKLPLFIAHR